MDLPAFLHLPDDPWVGTAATALLALALALLFELIGGAMVLRVLHENTVSGTVARRARGAVRFALPLLALQVVWGLAAESLPHLQQVQRLNSLALIAVLTWMVAASITAASDALIRLNPYEVEDNLRARRVLTQTRVLSRTLVFLVVLIGISLGLMSFPMVRHLGTSLLASAGVAGLVIGLAAKSVLGNLLAGIQLALTQPIRYDDVLIVQGQWGRVEEISSTYVVLHLWDERRLVVPLQWFIDNPFENWTRTTARLVGSIFWSVDYGMPIEPLRTEMQRLCREAREWDGKVCVLQVSDTTEKTMQLRGLASSVDSGKSWDLRCKLREGLIAFMQREYPQYLPRNRVEVERPEAAGADAPALRPA